MSNESKETIADIVRMIRKSQNGNVHTISPKEAYALADRIEAAAKREIEDAIASTVVAAAKIASEVYEPHIQSEPVGNTAKMREALEYARRFVSASAQRTDRDLLIMDEKRGAYVLTPKETLIKIDDALSAPPMEASNIARLRNIIDNISRLNDEWFDTFPTEEGQTGIHDAITCEVVEADKILAEAKGETDGSM